MGLYVAARTSTISSAPDQPAPRNWLLSSHFENTPLAVIEWNDSYNPSTVVSASRRIDLWLDGKRLWANALDGWRFTVEATVSRPMASWTA